MIIHSLVVRDFLQNLFLLGNIHDVFTFYSQHSVCLSKWGQKPSFGKVININKLFPSIEFIAQFCNIIKTFWN